MNQERLQSEIIAMSEADNFGQARTEWEVEHVYKLGPEEELETCLCGYPRIVNVCEIVNTKNGNRAVVGTSCVSRFLGPRSQAILKAMSRIIEDPTRSLNAAVLDLLKSRGVINLSDYNASLRTTRKRKLTASLRELRARVNNAAIAHFKRRDPELRDLATQQMNGATVREV